MLCLFLGSALTGSSALAQTSRPDGAIARTLKSWETTLERATAALRNPGVTVQVLETWQRRVHEVLREALAALAPAAVRVARERTLMKALGPAPGKDQKEPAETAGRRAQLQQSLDAAEQRARLLNLIVKRAETLRGRISGRRSDVLTARLMSSGPLLWSGQTWALAARDVGRSAIRITVAAREWAQSEKMATWLGGTGLFELALFILLAVLVLVWLRRWLDRVAGTLSKVETPNHRQRLIGTLIILINHGIVPAGVVLAAYGLVAGNDLLDGLFGEMLRGLAIGLALFFFIQGGARAALAPKYSVWRVLDIHGACARRGYVLAQVLAGLMAVDQVLAPILHGLYVSQEFIAVIGLLISGGMGLTLIMAGSKRLWARAAPADGAPPANPRPAAELLRRLVRLSGAVTLLAILLAYHNLAGFLAQNSALSCFILGGGWVLRHVLAALLDHVTVGTTAAAHRVRRRIGMRAEGAPILRIWLLLLIDIVLVASVIFLLVLVWGTDSLAAAETLRDLWHGMTIGGVTISVRNLLIAILVFIGLVMLVRSLQRQFEERIGSQTAMDIGVRRALRAGIGYAGVIMAAAIGISLAGFDLSNLAIIAGALSVGIGFGLQAIVNNFVSGIILFVERPVKEGDWIIVDGREGFVKRIGVRATEMVTQQNASVIIPNSKLISETVQNWLHKDVSGRVDINVGVAYGSDTDLVQKVLLECVKDIDLIALNPAPQALFMNFGDSSLDFQLRVYARNITEIYKLGSRVRLAIDKAFREHDISIPFPQRDLHVKTWPDDSQAPPDASPTAAPSGKPETRD